MDDMNLFSDKVCHYCGDDPGYDNENPDLWNGFFDQDMKILVCTKCKKDHYKAKHNSQHRGLYSEVPVYAKNNHSFYR